MNQHIVYRQKATITVAEESQAGAVQKQIRDAMNNDLPALLQEVFDSLAPGGDIIRIDTLRVDLGVLPAGNVGQIFKDKVVEKIREAIVVKKESQTNGNGVTIIHKEQSLREAFLYFLQYGIQPWFTKIKNKGDWESDMQQAFSKDDWQKIIFWIKQNYKPYPVIIERIICQFSDDFLEQIIINTISFDGESWKSIYKDLQFLFTTNRTTESSDRPTLLSLCLQSFLDEDSLPNALYNVVKRGLNNSEKLTSAKTSDVISEPGIETNSMLASNIMKQVIGKMKMEESPSLKGFEKKENSTKVEEEPIDARDIENKQMPADSASTSKITSPDSVSINPGIDNYIESREESGKDKETLFQKNAIDLEKSVSGIDKQQQENNRFSFDLVEKVPQYVSNSGIMLLHPFLEMYFAEFGLLQQKKFVGENACKRAVLLLHYLATGETESEEWNLLLQKMMCGLPLNETLPNKLELTDKEREESEKLLQSVINYCPPLKNTSLAGLRSTFLQRDGRLEKKENGWLLTVEQKTVDILLDKLPWGFSTIKFPWLPDMINVDWC